MKNLSEPLTDEELQQLSDFLLDRVSDEHDDDPDFSCGIIDVSELDGFLTAIVSGPNAIPPSSWLPVVWGEEAPVWESEDEFRSIFSLFVRHMNSIAAFLEADRDNFEPLFNESRAGGETHLIVDEWCFGYIRGVMLDAEAWQPTEPAVAEMLAPMMLFGTEPGWETLKKLEQKDVAAMRDGIPQAARDLYGYWLARRTVKSQPQRRAARKVGRNDPCPCGSGKKYKHCCLQ
jgi:uncharacterized protein